MVFLDFRWQLLLPQWWLFSLLRGLTRLQEGILLSPFSLQGQEVSHTGGQYGLNGMHTLCLWNSHLYFSSQVLCFRSYYWKFAGLKQLVCWTCDLCIVHQCLVLLCDYCFVFFIVKLSSWEVPRFPLPMYEHQH